MTDNYSNYSLFKQIYSDIYSGKVYKSVAYELSLLCNEKCIFCSRDAHILSEKEYLTSDEFYSTAKDYDIVTFCGGECTLDPRLPEFLQYCKNQGKLTSLITNGTSIKDINLCDKIFPNLDLITVSLPSLNKDVFSYVTDSDQYSSLIQGLRNLADYPKRLFKSVNIILLKSTLESLKETYHKLKEFNLKDFYLISMLYPLFLGRLQDIPEEYLSYREVSPLLTPVLEEIQKDGKLIRLENCSQCITPVPADFVDAEESLGKKVFYIKKINSELIYYTRDSIVQTFNPGKRCDTCPRKSSCNGFQNMSRILFEE